MTTDEYRVVIQPPYHDDQWACLWARFCENTFWHAPSKDAALDRLRERYDEPREVATIDADPTPESISIEAHPAFEGRFRRQR